ncbi:MAG: hypothetical protein RLZZ584_1159, partial [Pseudomonadota bacterium]
MVAGCIHPPLRRRRWLAWLAGASWAGGAALAPRP